MSKTYAEKLRDPRWQKLRLEKQDQIGWKCENCECKTVELHVHHRKYIRGREPWEYSLDQLQVLCKNCHQKHHNLRSQIDTMLADASESELVFLAAYMKTARAAMDSEQFDVTSWESASAVAAYFAHQVPGFNRLVDEIVKAAKLDMLINEPEIYHITQMIFSGGDDE